MRGAHEHPPSLIVFDLTDCTIRRWGIMSDKFQDAPKAVVLLGRFTHLWTVTKRKTNKPEAEGWEKINENFI